MIITKDRTVHFKRLTPALFRMLECLYIIDRRQLNDYPKDLVITSLNDSLSHSAKSRHYKDEALDLRSKNFKNKEVKLRFIQMCRTLLGPQFTILLESEGRVNEHFHFQVKKGETYP